MRDPYPQKALTNDPARHVFVDDFMVNLLELSPVLAARYRVVATCSSGDIRYLEPNKTAAIEHPQKR